MVDYYEFLNMTAEEMKENWLDFITARDPLLADRSDYTFNAILAEAVAAQFWIYVQLLKQIQQDTNPMTAEGAALSALVLDRLPEGRFAGTAATGALKFSRGLVAEMDYTIPSGTVVAVVGEDGTLLKYQTTEAVVLLTGTTSIVANAASIGTGTQYNAAANTVTTIITPVFGVQSATNELPFANGTDEEDDADLRRRYIYAIWEAGKATAPMMEEHIDELQEVREVFATTLGQGDVLLVVDSDGTVDDDIEDEIADNIAAGVTAPGMLGATLRAGGHTFEIGDCSGGKIWVRSRQYLSNPTTVPFEYTDTLAQTRTGTITLPAGTPEGGTVAATMQATEDLATLITNSAYAGTLSFDLYMAKGNYPYCWIEPELQAVDVVGTVELSENAEAGLIDSIIASVSARIDAYKVGETLHHSDIYKCFFVDYATGRVFVGVHDVPTLTVTAKATAIDFGENLVPEADERFEVGDLDGITEAT